MSVRSGIEADETRPGVLVLGIGNVLWADEGFGVRAVEALHARWAMPDGVDVVDGGTQGVYLLDHVCSADRVVVLDAIDFGLAPGTLRVYRDAEVPEGTGRAVSLHQATFQELLSLARVAGRFPERITLIGVQAAVLDDLGGSLSPVVRTRLDEAVALAVAELRAWGVEPLPRSGPPARPLGVDALAIDAYEAGRPSPLAACRIGDARFLPDAGGA
jgi:hydrogenase maturation protease